MANKPTMPVFPLGLEAEESSVFNGFTNTGTIEHAPGANMSIPEGTDDVGVPSLIRYNSDTDSYEGFYGEGGWLPFGGGGVRWEMLPHAASQTLVIGRGYFVDNSSAVSTVILPDPTDIGQSITICDYKGAFASFPLTIDPGVNKIYGDTEPLVVSTDNMTAVLTWTGAERGWIVTSGVGLGQGRVYSRTIYSNVLTDATDHITLSYQPSIVDVYVDGKRLPETKYTLDGYNVIFVPALISGQELQILQYTPIQLGTGVDRTLYEVARSTNVPLSQVIASSNTTEILDGKTVLYDVLAQKIWSLPSGIPTGASIVSVSGDVLTYSPGNVNVNLIPIPILADFISDISSTGGAGLIKTNDNKTVQEELDEKAIIGSEVSDTLALLSQPDGTTLIKKGTNTIDVLLDANRTALSSFTEHGGQLAAMREDLENPLTQYLGIVFCGDSITWGMGASGIAATDPRNHALADPRNNTTSKTFVNLVTKYIRDVFHYNPTVTETNWSGSPSGKCITTYNEEIKLFPGYAPFVVTGTWASLPTGITRPESSLNRILDTGTVGDYLTFEFTGYSFDIMFAALLSGASGFCAVYSNNVLVTEFSTAATDNGLSENTWGVRKTITLPSFVRKATIKIVYSKVATGASSSILRLEAIVVNKTTRITNQGIIGTTSYEWLTLLSSAISTGDKYCFMQIGINDRGGVSSQAYTPNALTENIKSIVASLRTAAVNPIICCSNQVSGTQLTTTMKYNTNSVAYALAKIAREQACDFVNNMPPTSLLRNFITYSDDGLHPNDIGHYAMYLNIVNAIHNSDGLKATRTTITTGSFAVINGNTDVVMQIPFVANNSGISSIELSIENGKYGIPGTVGIVSPDSNQYVSVGRVFVDTSAVNVLLKVTSNVAKTITLSVRAAERIYPF